MTDNYYTGCAVALGTFDGLHRGHMQLINCLLDQPPELIKVVYTFANLPGVFFGSGDLSLFTTQEKRAAFKKLGIDVVIIPQFDMKMAQMPPETFVDYLVNDIKVKSIICGFNYTFGAGAKGTPEMLKRLCEPRGIKVNVCEAVLDGELPVSSTLIRRALKAGNIKLANHMLGREYSVCGEIVEGKRIGRTINFPTINLALSEGKLYPSEGVYATRVNVGGETGLAAMTNIGTRPTIDGDPEIKIETHIFDYDRDVYGRWAEISFVDFIRPVQKFAGKEALAAQLAADKGTARKILSV